MAPLVICYREDIKNLLDSISNYIIIESKKPLQNEKFIDSTSTLLEEYSDYIRCRIVIYDIASGNLLLIAKFDSKKTDAIKWKLLDPRLPYSVTIVH